MVLRVVVQSVIVWVVACGFGWADVCTSRGAEWGGYGKTRVVHREGNLLLFGGRVLRVATLEVPGEPRETGELDLREIMGSDSGLTSISVFDGFAYLGMGTDGLGIVDLDDVFHPELVGRFDFEEVGWKIPALEVDSAIGLLGFTRVANVDDSRVVRIDVTNPTDPRIMDFIEVVGEIQAIHVAGRYAFVMISGHFPAEGGPHVSASLRAYDIVRWDGLEEVGRLEFPGSEPIAMAVDGETAVLLDWNGGVHVVNLSNPVGPEVSGFLDTGAFGRGGVALEEGVATVVYAGGLEVVDVSQATDPGFLGANMERGYEPGVAATGSWVYAAAGVKGLQLVDVSNGEAPALDVTLGAASYADLAALGDGVVAVYDRSEAVPGRGEGVIRLFTRRGPDFLKEVATSIPPGSVHDLVFARSHLVAWVDPAWSPTRCGLVSIEITDPPGLFREQEIPVCPLQSDLLSTMVADGDLLAVLDEFGTVQLIDTQASGGPEVVGEWPASGGPEAIALSGNTLLVCREDGVVDVVDVSDASAPEAVGSVTLSGSRCLAIAIEGERAVAAGRVSSGSGWPDYTNLDLFDVSTSDLVWTVEAVTQTDLLQLEVDGNLVHLLETIGTQVEHSVVDLTADEAETRSLYLRGSSGERIDVGGGVVAWAEGDGGLTLYEVDFCATPVRDGEESGRSEAGSVGKFGENRRRP